jgi:hypothetical protein
MLKYSGEWHSSIPAKSVLRNSSLSRDARLLWAILQSYASADRPQPYPGHRKLMRDMNCKKTALKKYQCELQDKGFLTAEQPRGFGRWLTNVYILHLPDLTEAAPTATVNTATVTTATVGAAPSNRHFEVIAKKQKEHHQQRAAVASGDADGNFDFEKQGDGWCFLTRWKQTYQQWFKTPYLQKPGEASQAGKIIKELDCRPKDLLAYAFRMWINTVDYDEVDPDGFDPLFYQIKGSRNMRFFLSHLMEMAEEQKEPLDCCLKVVEKEYQQLEQVIALGRPD